MIDLSFSMAELEFFLAVVVRVTTFMFSAPFFSTPNVPRRVKVAFGVLFSVLIYSRIGVHALEYSTVLGYTVIIIKEAIVGILLGYSANICVAILNYAGHITDMDIGLSMVSLFDPVTKSQTTVSGSYYQYTVTLILLISGMYQYVVAAIVQSFSLIPVNGAVFSSERILSAMVSFLTDYLVLGFRICLPIFAAIIILNAVLGILAKVSPQMNMFAVGMQLKILVGLGILFITVGLLPAASSLILSEMKKMITMFMEAMAA